jgi:predicted NAD/FAD-dependent oxidoreductase
MAQKHAAYDSTGAIIGFYDEVDSPLPSGVNAIPINDEQWRACLGTPGHTVQDGALVAPTPASAEEQLATARNNQVSALRHAEQTTLTRGFSSDALGQPHTYPSNTGDLLALFVALGDAGTSIWCMDAEGAWSYAPHSVEQIDRVMEDLRAFRQAQQTKLGELVQQVRAAITADAVRAITWG